MKEPKFGRSRFFGINHGFHSSKGTSNKGSCKLTGITMFGLILVVLMLGPGYISDLPAPAANDDVIGFSVHERSYFFRTTAPIASIRNMSFSFHPEIHNWDVQRTTWLKENNHVERTVLLVTGSQHTPCERPIDTHMLLKSARNKVHYTRLHGMHMHYSLLEPHEELTGSWAKLPVLRMLMLAHPEVEFFWWMGSDTVVTDMKLELPFDKYDGHNFVVYGDDNRIHQLKDWNALQTSNFLIRNCQWSLLLLDAWASMGAARSRKIVGKLLSNYLTGRPEGLEADEQSALVYLLATERKRWDPKFFIEKDLLFTASWIEVTGKLEEMEHYSSGDPRLPVVTHFAGCSQCGGKTSEWPWEQCEKEMKRAMDFSDNQVYETYGYKLRNLGIPEISLIPLHKLPHVVASPELLGQEYQGFPIHKLPGPPVKDWNKQRLDWFTRNPGVNRTNALGRPKTMIVTGSSYRECSHPVGGHLLLQALKNKVDYARFHDLEFFYGMWDFDEELTYWWTKIPTLRLLMLTRPDVEWFWWCDADGVITDMVFEVPFENYDDKNFILYGDYDLISKRNWIAVNAGIYLVRNCQWTLDFFDVWASLGAKSVSLKTGELIAKLLDGLDTHDADDQSSFIYMLVTDTEKRWAPQISLEKSFTISGYWKIITHRYEEMKSTSHAGLGNMEWPWITHFAGCQPCGTNKGNFDVDECRAQMQRAFDFGDDQILDMYGFEHSPLGNPEVKRLPEFVILPENKST